MTAREVQELYARIMALEKKVRDLSLVVMEMQAEEEGIE